MPCRNLLPIDISSLNYHRIAENFVASISTTIPASPLENGISQEKTWTYLMGVSNMQRTLTTITRICFYGRPGLNKTFLCNSIAKICWI